MSDQSNAHQAVVWAKQRLNDLDTMISEAEKSADKLKASASKEAEIALARLLESRHRLQKYHDDLRARLTQRNGARRIFRTRSRPNGLRSKPHFSPSSPLSRVTQIRLATSLPRV